MYLLHHFILQNLKRILKPNPELSGCAENGPKWLICPKQFFLVQTIIITLIYLLALFIVQNLQKFLTVDPTKKKKKKKRKIITIIFIYLLTPFIVQNLKKKSFQQILNYEDAQFLGPKWPICPNKNFFRKPVNEPCSFHSYLSTSQNSK